MAHQNPDSLLPNEVLARDESLVSTDGRFRLELNSGGYWQVIGFADDSGPVIMAPLPQPSGPGGDHISLNSRVINGRGQPTYFNAAGLMIGSVNPLRYRTATSVYLIMQSDGNLVYYCNEGDGGFSNWALLERHQLPDIRMGRIKCVMPNATTVNVSTPGVVFVAGSGQGQGEIINDLDAPIGIRTPETYVKLEPHQTISVVRAGDVALESAQYNFTDSSVTVRQNSDNHVASDRGGRWVVGVGGTGLRLRFRFSPADTYSMIDVAKARLEGFPVKENR